MGVYVWMEYSTVVEDFWRFVVVVVLYEYCYYEIDVGVQSCNRFCSDLQSYKFVLHTDIGIDCEVAVGIRKIKIFLSKFLPQSLNFQINNPIINTLLLNS